MFDWTEDRVATLRDCVAAGQSSTDAATTLGRHARILITPNAILKKARKLGLKFHSQTDHPPSKNLTHRPRRRSAHSEEMLAQYAGGQLPPVAFTPNPASTDGSEIPVEQRKTLIELEARDCRWPFGDPQSSGLFFCAAETVEGFSYCRTHCRIAYQGRTV